MEKKTILIDNSYRLTFSDYAAVTRRNTKIKLSDSKNYIDLIDEGNKIIKDYVNRNIPVYGVTTGFGDSCRNQVHYREAKKLQENLIKFHGCGVGKRFSETESLGVMLIRLISNARGYSGVTYKLLKQIEQFINIPIVPLIPEQGTVGASGDLTPLSYLAAALTGRRKVIHKGKVVEAMDALKDRNLKPIQFEPKEALALINGTSVMTALAAFCSMDARKIACMLELTSALTVEVLKGNKGSFLPLIHENKPYDGQIKCAKRISKYLSTSKIALTHEEIVSSVKEYISRQDNGTFLKRAIQDKYSVRCSPHVIGVLWDTLKWVEDWVTIEMNSVNDNPLIDYRTGKIYSGGNFYGGHICQAMDSLRAIIGNVADLIDKQLELVIDEKFSNGLPPNLIFPGSNNTFINHGLKAIQITCTSLTAEILSLSGPTGIHSRPTESMNQDKVSLGTISARYTRDVIRMAEYLIAIQLITLCQAMDLRGIDKFSDIAKELLSIVRNIVPFISNDRELDEDIENLVDLISGDSITVLLSKYSDST